MAAGILKNLHIKWVIGEVVITSARHAEIEGAEPS